VAALARPPAVAGSFYPADRGALAALVDHQLETARPPDDAVRAVGAGLAGILVPHAGLSYSGPVAAAAWKLAGGVRPDVERGAPVGGAVSFAATTVVLLGTNHSAAWLHGVGAWEAGAWLTPLGPVEVDEDLAEQIVALGPPFGVDRDAHLVEHSLEVQLPFLRRAMPDARVVPLAVGTGTGDGGIRAGERLGRLIAERRASGADIRLAISTDMAHYPPAAICARVTDELAPLILALEPAQLARRESELARSGLHGVVCGMCGIQPAVLGLAALRAMGVRGGVRLADATSADTGGGSDRTVGYLAAAFPG